MDDRQQSQVTSQGDIALGNTAETDIVVGVDGSPESFAALRWALHEAELSGQHINAVFGWTTSWGMGGEPQTDADWNAMRDRITDTLREWVDKACHGIDVEPSDITLTPVRASGTAALLHIGAKAQQIVVGRRSLGRVMRWLSPSTSAALAEESHAPVTIVPNVDADADDVQSNIASALGSAKSPLAQEAEASADGPFVVAVDGSPVSERALRFAARTAKLHRAPLHAVFCWQLKELSPIPGYENAVAPISAGQAYAEDLIRRMVEATSVPDAVEIQTHAFHIPAAKGLIDISRYAGHLIMGSRGLNGLDARFLGSVSRQVVNLAQCPVTVVH
ncbi:MULTISPECIES: universal stress protein [Bifidobacterium]|jgi:nucleotide-binding universal stress UspA family protein|uniref:Universal stress protein n=1 Tax=Bifidobacterium tibiigranuli TaxID=2172043 RepID=A0A5N6RYQ8_9BIFI|nr:universal stress protein [Bifidobacterium tibiigranuli]KAE8127201.1 universal stress protein [Bifidobacterium tibiigranuli]KAE8127576.1 universal stress protein [Bifidobacterium tibiigranuli]MCH3974282.1 universal stress protein [Bifidobacterium tibiigranuli]MCH4188845.1 universal stress protein [Bifidobacterium tibiigranuli]MCH4203250.1 universal stress protein [Bifidobacterium tibiigranuli]